MIRVAFIFCVFAVSVATQAATPSSPAKSNAQDAAPQRRPLRQILIAEGLENAQRLDPLPDAGFLVIAPPLEAKHLKVLEPKLIAARNRLIDEPLLASIAQVIEVHFRQNDLPLACALIPPQSIGEGAIRVALLPGKIRHIRFEGNRWFSDSLLRAKLKIEEGQIFRLSAIEKSINWANSSSFRNIRMHLQPVANTGEVDVQVGVTEQAPWRVFAALDNSGNDLLGERRLTFGATAGNLWASDHQFTYQHITTDFSQIFQAHVFEYRAPLPWRHTLSVSGSVLRANPSFFEGLFTQKGRSLTADLRYSLSLWRNLWRFDFSGGISAKQTNNNLEYGGTPVLGSTLDSFTFVLGGTALREDSRGRTILGASFTTSPGNLNRRNADQLFNESRLGAKSRFSLLQVNIERVTRLAPDTASLLKVGGQLAAGNLIPAEQLSLGGSSTVRGYKERLLTGDHGYMASHELHWKIRAPKISKKGPPIETAGIGFWDFGRNFIHTPLPSERRSDYLASAGLGMRITMANILSISLDHAWQLEKVELPGERPYRTHFRMMVSF